MEFKEKDKQREKERALSQNIKEEENIKELLAEISK